MQIPRDEDVVRVYRVPAVIFAKLVTTVLRLSRRLREV